MHRTTALILMFLFLAACAGGQQQQTPAPNSTEGNAVLRPSAAGAPRLTSWRIVGPGGGGAMYTPAVSPHDPNLVFVSTDMTGAFISEDGGDTWRQFNLRMTVSQFAFDPFDAKVIYAVAGGAGTYRSEDRGRTWQLFFPAPASVTRLGLVDDEGEPMIWTTGGYIDLISSMVIDPADSNVIYACFAYELRVTRDRGRTWNKVVQMTGVARRLWIDPKSPAGNRTIYAVGTDWFGAWEGGVWRSDKPVGTSWVYDWTGGFTPEGEPVFYLIIDEKEAEKEEDRGWMVVSVDGGRTWKSIQHNFFALRNPGSKYPGLRAVSTSAGHPDTVYVSFAGMTPPDDPESLLLGVGKSTDRGQTWELVWRDTSRRNADNVDEPWLSERFGTEWGENPHQMHVSEKNPDIVFATDLGRTTRTTDGGKTWKGVYSKRVTENSWTSTGLDVLTCYGVHFDPFNPNRMFVSYTDIGMFRSEDRGQTWVNSGQGIPRKWGNTAYWIEFDPAVKGRMWAGVSANHDLPRMKMLGKVSPKTVFIGGVVMSEDGGLTWRTISEGIPETSITHIMMEPNSPPEARVLYATGFMRGVFKSTDGGQTWNLKKNGLPEQPLCWRMHRDANGVLYLILVRRNEDGEIDAPSDGMIFRSRDAGENWERLKLPVGVNAPSGIVTDPRDPNRIYFTSFSRYKRYNLDPLQTGGLFISTNGGSSWSNPFSSDQHLYDVTLDPRNPDIVYVAGLEASAYRSTDRGEKFTRIRGFNFKFGHRVIPDPLDPEMVFITTYGSSIWYGPATGDGGPLDEDIVTQAKGVAYTASAQPNPRNAKKELVATEKPAKEKKKKKDKKSGEDAELAQLQ